MKRADGPRFWHGGVILRRAEFWLCSYSSLSGRVDRADGPDLSAIVNGAEIMGHWGGVIVYH